MKVGRFDIVVLETVAETDIVGTGTVQDNRTRLLRPLDGQRPPCPDTD